MNRSLAEAISSRELAGIMPCHDGPPKRVASPLETHEDDPLDGCVLELNIRNTPVHPFLRIEQWEPFPGLGEDGDWEDKSVRSSRSSRSWWNRRRRIGSQQKQESVTEAVSPPKGDLSSVGPKDRSDRSVSSLRKKWRQKSKRKSKRTPSKKHERKNSDQLVLEFFDVDAIESEADKPPRRGLRRRASMDHHHMEGQRMEGRTSVQSNRTQGSSIAAFLRKFSCIKFSNKDKTVDDDEDITLASGLGRITPATEMEDEYDDLTVGSGLTPNDNSTLSRERGWKQSPEGSGGEEEVLRENKTLLRELLRRRRRSGTIIISGDMMREVLSSTQAEGGGSTPCDTISETMDASSVSNSDNGSRQRIEMRSVDGLSDLSSNSSRGRSFDGTGKGRTKRPDDPASAKEAMRNCFSGSQSVNSGSWAGETEPETETSSIGDDEFVGSIGETARDSNSGARDDEYESNPSADEASSSQTSMLSGLLATWAAEKDAIRRGTKRARAKALKRLYPFGKGPDVPKKSAIKASEQEGKPGRKVVFDRVEIRSYDRTLGDNPSCVSGPPLTIDWSYTVAYESAVDQFESLRPKRRTKREFHLSPNARSIILMRDWNVTEEEIRKVRQQAASFQTSRQAIASSRSAAMSSPANTTKKTTDSDASDVQPGFFRRVGRRNSLDIYIPPSARVSSGHLLYEPATRACL